MTETDLDSIIYAQDQQWIVGNAEVQREEIADRIYSELPNRYAMYKTSLNQLIPIGDTSISGEAGDPQYSKTPAGVKFQQSQLSIDDEDYKDNVDMTYEAVAKSMINTHFANKQGKDLVKLKDEEVEILAKSGIEFPIDENGEPSRELEITWDEARAKFDFADCYVFVFHRLKWFFKYFLSLCYFCFWYRHVFRMYRVCVFAFSLSNEECIEKCVFKCVCCSFTG